MAVQTVPRRLVIGRYVLEREIGVGGMASVYLGRAHGDAGFSRLVAIKRLHPQFAKDAEFANAMVDEARIVARISHTNVVQVLDVVTHEGELLIVMELLQGETLARLMQLHERPLLPALAAKVVLDVLSGLHAAHEARGESGAPLELVHRDVSPQNVIVGSDGTARLIDFGVAKAIGRMQQTRDGRIKGKLGYFAPETIRDGQVDRRVDVYAAGVMLWEVLTGTRLFTGENELQVLSAILNTTPKAPSSVASGIPPGLDAVVLRALSHDLNARYPTAEAMAEALDAAVDPARSRAVGDWVRSLAQPSLAEREAAVSEVARDRAVPASGANAGSGVVNRAVTARLSAEPSQTERLGDLAVDPPATRAEGPPVTLDLSGAVDSEAAIDTPLLAAIRPPRDAPTLMSEGTPPPSSRAAHDSGPAPTLPATPMAAGALAPTQPALTPKVPERQVEDHVAYQEARIAWLEGRMENAPARVLTAEPNEPGRARWLVLLVALVALGALALMLSFPRPGAEEIPLPAPTAPSPLEEPVLGDPVSPPTASEPEPNPPNRQKADPSAAVPAPLQSAPIRVPPPTVGRKERGTDVLPQPTPSATVTPPNCTPPYWIDSKGVKRWKPECVR